MRNHLRNAVTCLSRRLKLSPALGGGSSLSSENPVPVFRRRHPALRTFSEPTVAIAGDKTIDGITQKCGNYAQHAKQPPGHAKRLIDRKNTVAVLSHPLAIDDEQADRILGSIPCRR